MRTGPTDYDVLEHNGRFKRAYALVLGSHASGFQVHIFASVPAAQYTLGVGYLIEGTHAESAFRPGLRT
jgi:hypothetical protein